MFGSTVLEIAIGMAFLFSLFSLITTAANELIASRLRMRSANLAKGIENMVGAKYAEKLYAHPLINALGNEDGKPSYIPANLFVTALLDILSQEEGSYATNSSLEATLEKLPESKLKSALKLLARNANHELADFKVDFEGWFNSAMERVSGWYKRRVQFNLLAISALGTILLNVDSMAIINRLYIDSTLRQSIVKKAERPHAVATITNVASISQPEATVQPGFDDLMGDLKGLQLPIGWIKAGAETNLTGHFICPQWPWQDGGVSLWNVFTTHAFGWLITILAVSLGAPFWFDLLNKFINIRASGKAPEESPKNPKELPKAV